jgi:hypothetical protein
MTYNDIIQKAGKRIKKHVYYIENNTTTNVSDDNVERVKFNTQSSLLGTCITGCEITLKEKIGGAIYVQIEAKYGTDTATKTYGPFNLKEEPIYDASKKTYLHKTYDNLLKSMVEYTPITINYPCTIYQFFSQLVSELGYTNNIASLPNGTLTMESDIYDGIGFTYRDVLDDIAYANGVLFYMNQNEIKIATLGGNSITIDDDILKNKNIDFSEHYGPINSIVLSRSSDTDSIYLKDDQSIAQNGLCEFKIKDNQLMNGNNRADFLPVLLSQLDGVNYDIYDVEITGYGELTPLQSVQFSTNNQTYNSYIFNNEITLTSGYKQAIYNDKPEQTESDYKYMTENDKTIWETGIIIDKKVGDVDIRGKTINLTSDSIAIDSTYFKVDTGGNVIANSLSSNNATITGGSILINYPNYNGKTEIRALGLISSNDYGTGYFRVDNIIGPNIQLNATNGGFLFTNTYILANNTTTPTPLNTKLNINSSGTITCQKITAGNIDCGTCTLDTGSADIQVNFNKTFANPPKVVITPFTSTAGVIAPKVKSVTTTYFTATIGGSGFSNINCNWIAIE